MIPYIKANSLINKMRYLILFIGLLLGTLFVTAQSSEIKFDHISLKDGLSQSSVTAIMQDSKGFMWFGTLDGLNKYDGYKITVYRNHPNLPTSISDNSITDLFEDDKQTLWIGTQSSGLCVYNKLKDNFIIIKPNPKQANTLASEQIKTICQDKAGDMWFGTVNGLTRAQVLDRNPDKFAGSLRFTHFTALSESNSAKSQYALSSNIINKVIVDLAGNLWIATDKGLNMLIVETNQVVSFTSNLKNPNQKNSDIINSRINTLLLDKNNILWMGTDFGMYCLDIQQVTARTQQNVNITAFTKFQNIDITLQNTRITTIVADNTAKSNETILWLATEKYGIYRLLINDNQLPQLNNFKHDASEPFAISVDNVITLYLSKNNVLWVGTSLGGLNKWDRTTEGVQLYRHNPYYETSLNTSLIRSIYQDRAGEFWIGTVDGGLNHWNTKTNVFTHYVHNPNDPNSITNNHVRSILEDKKGNFWLGTDGGGLVKFDRKTKKAKHYQQGRDSENKENTINNNYIWKIFEDSRGNLWIGTFGGGITLFDVDNLTFKAFVHNPDDSLSISDNRVTTIYEDHLGVIWVGTYGGGINKMIINDDDAEIAPKFYHYKHDENNNKSIGNNRIYSIIEDKEGLLWIGAKANLNRFDRKTNTFHRYTVDDGLPNNVIMGILEDHESNLWISSNSGISKFIRKEKKFRNYDISDGFQSNEFLVGSFYKTAFGKMLFGGVNGFNAFYPQDIKDNQSKPEIVITRFQIFNQDVELDTNITEKKQLILDYSDNVFSFDFVALNYVFSEKNNYAYRMVGFDKDWNYVKNRRFASYTSLAPGEYTFTVIGSNNDGVWNMEGTTIHIIITPPFWRTTWFYILVAVLVISGIYGFIKMRERQLIRDKRILEETVELRTREIQEQKKEIEKQRDLARLQKANLEENIVYASSIQDAILPPKEYISKIFPRHFILYKPKDIVSGDYYWMNKKESLTFIAVADCTGHGVSGAFMSMLGIAFLNAIMYKHFDARLEKQLKASEILNELRENVKSALHQTLEKDKSQAGMDMALCIFDFENYMMQYAGAYSPVIIIRNKEFMQIKGDMMPVGIFFREKPSFTNNEIQLEKGDAIYIFSDGYVDQFGGDKKRRFLAKNFQKILIEISDKDMDIQRQILDKTFDEWRGEYEQVDDVLVWGVKIE